MGVTSLGFLLSSQVASLSLGQAKALSHWNGSLPRLVFQFVRRLAIPSAGKAPGDCEILSPIPKRKTPRKVAGRFYCANKSGESPPGRQTLP